MKKPSSMTVNVLGRIRNTPVPYAHAFIPLFEAVVNSIHAIEDRFGEHAGRKGRIDVEIQRVPPHPELPHMPGPGRPPIAEIASITVTDNGVGFTTGNMESFSTADSTAKADRGGRGVGRFTWLVVFDEAQIESTIDTGRPKHQRNTFYFRPTKAGIEDRRSEPTDAEISTKVKLTGVKKRYAEALRTGPEAIADRLFEHCFNYFILDQCPPITLADDASDGPTRIDVNARMNDVHVDPAVPLCIGAHHLSLLHVQRRYVTARRHEAHLCANKRVVESFSLVEHSGLSPEPFRNARGEPVVEHAFVIGQPLDDAVDGTRTRLNLPDGLPLLEKAGVLDLKTLRQMVGAEVDKHLAEVLRAEREENFERIKSHIRTSQPEYRHLIHHRSEAIGRVHWTEDEAKLDEKLYRVQQEWELEVRHRQRAVEAKLSLDNSPEDIAEELARVIAEVNQQGQANLVRYVAKRRAILHLLRKLISVTSGPALESRVHAVVFPLRKTGDQVPYDDHNLWLVDDTLSFYEILCSDKPLSQVENIPSDSKRRPDILALKTGDPYQHVAMVEFKRPDRADDNPVQQLVNYAVLLRDGGARNVHGVTMPGIPKSVRIDAYAVCTLSPELENLIRRGPGNMEKVAEEGRWYGAVPGENLWLEVLDFQAFIRRAEQRNRAFFTKLGLS